MDSNQYKKKQLSDSCTCGGEGDRCANKARETGKCRQLNAKVDRYKTGGSRMCKFVGFVLAY